MVPINLYCSKQPALCQITCMVPINLYCSKQRALCQITCIMAVAGCRADISRSAWHFSFVMSGSSMLMSLTRSWLNQHRHSYIQHMKTPWSRASIPFSSTCNTQTILFFCPLLLPSHLLNSPHSHSLPTLKSFGLYQIQCIPSFGYRLSYHSRQTRVKPQTIIDISMWGTDTIRAVGPELIPVFRQSACW